MRPPPKTTYEGPRETNEIDKQREIHQRQAMEKLQTVRTLPFHHVQTEKSMRTLQRQEKILEATEKSLQFDIFRANPMPKSQVKNNFDEFQFQLVRL